VPACRVFAVAWLERGQRGARSHLPRRAALPPIPDWYSSSPTGNGVPYDGSSFFNSGPLYAADAGRSHSFTLTFTKAGTFPYVDVGDFALRMQGSVTVAP
jgi:hypothetical protein